MLERCLEDLEGRIDTEVEDALYEEWVEFTEGRFADGIFSPKRGRAAPPGFEWPDVRVNETLDDFDRMALQQYAGCSGLLAGGGGGLMCVRSNYGTGILSSLFGTELFVMPDETNTLPGAKPLAGGIAVIEALVERGVPDVDSGLMAKALETGRRFVRIAGKYPKIGRYVHVYHPDLQGPMDICELILGSELFLALVDGPDLMKRLLALVTETYVECMNAWNEIAPSERGHAVHWSLMHAGRIMLRDDSAMNLSPDMFDEFVFPYDQRLLEEFANEKGGGGGLHFCGRGDHYIARASEMKGLRAINMSQPEYNDMETIYANTVDRGIAIVGLDRKAAEEALARGRDLHGLVHSW